MGAAGGAICGASLGDWSNRHGSSKEQVAGALLPGIGAAVLAGAEFGAIGFSIGTLVDGAVDRQLTPPRAQHLRLWVA